MLNYQEFSNAYQIIKVTEAQLPAVLKLCQSNPTFYQYCPPMVNLESLKGDLVKLPKHKTNDDKYYLAYYEGNELVAVLDLITNYPSTNVAFIAFYMLDKSFEGKGIGTAIINELELYLKTEGYLKIMLAWVDGNDQSSNFWHKLAYKETGKYNDVDGYRMIFAKKEL